MERGWKGGASSRETGRSQRGKWSEAEAGGGARSRGAELEGERREAEAGGRSQLARGGTGLEGKRSGEEPGGGAGAGPAREGRGEVRAHLAPRAVGYVRRGVSRTEVANPGGLSAP